MAKTYTVSSTHSPTPLGGHRYKIDTIPNPLDQKGLALSLNVGFVQHGVFVPSAHHDAQIAFSAAQPAIYTKGMMNCFALCVAYNKLGEEFHNGYLAHISNPKSAFFQTCVQRIPNPNNTVSWVVVSVGGKIGGWATMIANDLVAYGIPANNIWIYLRQSTAAGFGLDRFGNFGEV